MIHIEHDKNTITATDPHKNIIELQAMNWKNSSEDLEINRTTHDTIHGTTTKLKLPTASISIDSEGNSQWYTLTNQDASLKLPVDNHLIKVESQIALYIKFSESAQIKRNKNGSFTLEFSQPTSVALGFKARAKLPNSRMSVPRTASGLATALTHFSSAIEVTSPDRSYPALRNYPPLIEFGRKFNIPKIIRDKVKNTGIKLFIPENLSAIAVSAPLAYYLQATVEIKDVDTPILSIGDSEYLKHFDHGINYQQDANELLKQVFFLDCLVREEGPYPAGTSEIDLLNEIELDADDAYFSDPSHRLSIYSEVDFDKIKERLPSWHLAFYVHPTYGNCKTLPHILDRMGLIYTTQGIPYSKGELVVHSVESAYTRQEEVTSTDNLQEAMALRPKLEDAFMHGWIGEGIPIDAFKVIPEAFMNRINSLTNTKEPLRLTVIRNDPDLQEEPKVVIPIYEERRDKLPVEIIVKHSLSVNELANIFESEQDFVHYIGHCESSGLKCSNGFLSINSINKSGVKTFILNACKSFTEGYRLIEKGSIAGVVTLNEVFDEHATQVGYPFARLIIHGYSIDQALQIAKPSSIVNKIYTVVGDGTFTLSQGTDTNPPIVYAEKSGNTQYHVKILSYPPDCFGTCCQDITSRNSEIRLSGNAISKDYTEPEFIDLLCELESPIIMGDSLHWPDKLLNNLK